MNITQVQLRKKKKLSQPPEAHFKRWVAQVRKGAPGRPLCALSPQFSYVDADGAPVSVVQLTFLKLLSATARQSFTYSCQNSAAWLDEAAGDHGRALRFLGTNGEELSFGHTAAATVAVPYDGCRVRERAGRPARGGAGRGGRPPPTHAVRPLGQLRKGQTKTLLELRSSRVGFLPLWDVAASDFGQTNQKFGFELGPVCFSS